jgi:hypothetical protein
MVLGVDIVAQNMEQKFSRTFGDTQQHHSRHLLYAGSFAHFSNWLVKVTPAKPYF